MKPTFFQRRTASAISLAVLLTIVVLGGWSLAPEGLSQAPTVATVPTATLLPLLAKLKAQQALIAANQTKIEAQTALLQENLRQAKIYSARSGSGHR